MAKKDKTTALEQTDKKLLTILILIVAAIVILIHWPAISCKTLLFDDDQYLTDNMLVQNPSLASAKQFLTEILAPSTVQGYYQPLTMISLMLDYAIAGRADNLMPFHLTSLLLHAANTALIIILLYLLFKQVWIAAGLGLLFGLHPMTIEGICWIAQRKALLAAFFALCSLLVYVKYANKRNLLVYITCLIFYILAIMAKPTALPLPILMLLLDFWPLNQFKFKRIWEKIPFFIIAFFFAIATYISQKDTAIVITPVKQGFDRILLMLCHNIIFYPYKMIWPSNLSSHYVFPKPFSLSSPMVLAGVIGTCILLPLLIISLRWTKALITGWMFFFVAIFPTMGVVGFSTVIAYDNYAYLPSVGFLMIICYLLKEFYINKKIIKKSLLIIMILTLACAESIATQKHTKYWQDTRSYFQYLLSLTPNAAPLHSLIGCDYLDQKKYDEALNHFQKALELDPNNYINQFNMAKTLQSCGKYSESIDYYNKALKIYPRSAITYYALGLLYKSQGDLEPAIFNIQKAIKIKPSMFNAYNTLGNIFAKQQKYDEALNCYQRSLDINPKYTEAIYNLAETFETEGKFDEAIMQYSNFLKINPNDADVYFNLGSIFQSQDRNNEAIQCYLKTIEIKPDYAKAHNNIGGILLMAGNLDLAAEHFQAAIELQPNYTMALNGLARILATHPETQKRDPLKAIALGQKAAGLTNYQDIQILDTLFNAFLSGGQVPNAISTLQAMQKLALQNNNKQWIDYIDEQLKIYPK